LGRTTLDRREEEDEWRWEEEEEEEKEEEEEEEEEWMKVLCIPVHSEALLSPMHRY
jgi:hypothetical protein